jgi:hypothetical protein
MCTTKGPNAADIFEKIENVISHNQIPWDKCVAFSVDNASVNMGKRNSIKSRVLVKNPDVYFVGCSCHMTHNAAHKGRDNFSGVSEFDV